MSYIISYITYTGHLTDQGPKLIEDKSIAGCQRSVCLSRLLPRVRNCQWERPSICHICNKQYNTAITAVTATNFIYDIVYAVPITQLPNMISA